MATVDNKHKEFIVSLDQYKVFLGKAGFFIMLGMLHTIVSVGDLLILKAGVESPGLFGTYNDFLFIIFNSIVYTCVSLLGNPGKAITLFFNHKLQVVGGTFPSQTTPQSFQNICVTIYVCN